MALKPTHTALYELMGRKRAERPPAPEQKQKQEPPPQSWRNSAGRTVRLPVGYLWLAGAGGILLLVAAFSTGYMRGHDDATTTLEREWMETRQPTLAVPPPEVELRDPAGRAKPAAGPEKATATARPAAGGPGPILSDPREVGINYFILIHTHRENAVELARFCRQDGVEAYAVPDRRNRSLYRVLVLPGYARGQRSSEPVRALEQRIADVTRKWKLQVNPRDELGYYPERFSG
jgi:hypothetical protein